jgi:hypothetical protein
MPRCASCAIKPPEAIAGAYHPRLCRVFGDSRQIGLGKIDRRKGVPD